GMSRCSRKSGRGTADLLIITGIRWNEWRSDVDHITLRREAVQQARIIFHRYREMLLADSAERWCPTERSHGMRTTGGVETGAGNGVVPGHRYHLTSIGITGDHIEAETFTSAHVVDERIRSIDPARGGIV